MVRAAAAYAAKFLSNHIKCTLNILWLAAIAIIHMMTSQIVRYLCVGFRREIQLYFRYVSGDSEGRPATVLRARQVRGGAAAGGVGGDGGQGDVDAPQEDLDNEASISCENLPKCSETPQM